MITCRSKANVLKVNEMTKIGWIWNKETKTNSLLVNGTIVKSCTTSQTNTDFEDRSRHWYMGIGATTSGHHYFKGEMQNLHLFYYAMDSNRSSVDANAFVYLKENSVFLERNASLMLVHPDMKSERWGF